jgi:hypothetical protein
MQRMVPPSPTTGGWSGAKIALIVGGAVVLVGAIAAAVVLLLVLPGRDETQPVATATTVVATTVPNTTVPTVAAPLYATPEEALQAFLDAGWVYKLVAENATSKEYWVGPPQSEFVGEVIVEPSIDGGWVVVESYALEMDEEVSAGDVEMAQNVVEDFLYAVMNDRAEDAHALTIEPFSYDAASASYGNGDFTDFVIEQVAPVGDGTYWVYTAEQWYSNTEYYMYQAVPTEAGWRIRDCMPQ